MPRRADLPPYLSVSQVLTYLQCARKYRLRYVDRLPPESRKVEMAFGSAVHGTVAWWIEERMQGRDPTAELVHRTFRADWTAEQAIDIPILGSKAPSELLELGTRLATEFAECFREETFTGAEVRFEVEVVDVRAHRQLPVPLVGFLDFTTERYVGEIKTAGRKASWRNWELQLAAYRYAARQVLPGELATRVVQLMKTKAGGVEIEDAPVAEAHERWFIEVACEVYDSASQGAFHPAPTYQCMSCEYAQACRGR